MTNRITCYCMFWVADFLLVLTATCVIAAPPIREFDARITAVSAAEGMVTIHHNATQYTVTLRTDGDTVYQRVRQAPLAEFPTGQLMRFWGALDANSSSILIQGIRRAPSDDQLQPAIVPAQNHVAGASSKTTKGSISTWELNA
jgi:hypothetical protein